MLRDHPYVLVIEDDHYSLLSQLPYHSLIGAEHRRWALVRSVSKFLGPDMCLAVTASDPETADRLAMRLTPGTTWVSHLLQRLVRALATDPEVAAGIRAAGEHYAARNAVFAELLTAEGIPTRRRRRAERLGAPRRARPRRLRTAHAPWVARHDPATSSHSAPRPSDHLRLTVHDLGDADLQKLAADLGASVRAVRR